MGLLINGQVGWRTAGVVGAPAAATSLLLDTYSGAAAAYSLRKLRTAYTGYAIRVRRSSDDTTIDVGFKADGTLDTTSMLSFVGTGSTNNGFISIWYDQSGNGKNATQPASANQPHIVINGVLQTYNGKPSVFFNGDPRFLDCGYLNNGTKPSNFSTFISGNFTQLTTTRVMFGSGNNAGQGLSSYNSIGVSSSSPTAYQMYGGVGNGSQYRYWVTTNVPTQSSSYLFEQHYKSNTSPYLGVFYWNNILQSSNDWLGGSAQQSSSTEFKTSIGRGGEYNGLYHQGYVQEITTYFSDQTANRSGISSNINSFYSIY